MPRNKPEYDIVTAVTDKVDKESTGPYKVIYDRLTDLGQRYPRVHSNQYDPVLGTEALEYSAANLLYSLHAAFCVDGPIIYTRKNSLDVVQFMCHIPKGKSLLIEYLDEHVPQAVMSVEHLFFLQRQIRRNFDLPVSERIEPFRSSTVEDWCYPDVEIERLRTDVLDIWNKEEGKRYAGTVRS